ncbi:MAG: hypothetical protein Kow00133_06360 [Amphiplicatus sp.]
MGDGRAMRTLAVLLFVSLAANVFLGGFVAGRLVGGPPSFATPSGHQGWPGRLDHNHAAATLSEEGREAFRGVFEAHRDEIKAGYREIRRLRRAYAETLAADPWNRARAEAALEALQEAEAAHERTMGRALLDAVERLSVEDRQALIKSMEKKRRKWRREDRRSGPDEGAPPQRKG